MKTFWITVVTLGLALAVSAQNKTVTTDTLTSLPVSPATDPGLNIGNAPTTMPDTTVCKSKMQGQFYSLSRITTDAAVEWYSKNLPGFKVAKRSDVVHGPQIVFYKPDGTLLVIVNASSVAYERYTPGLAEKTILGIPQGKLVCP